MNEGRSCTLSLGFAVAITIAIAVVPLPSLAELPVPSGWEYAQELAIPAPGLVELAISPAVLDRALGELEDVRVVDGAGREVPYLFRAKPRPPVRTEAVAAEISQSGVEDATVAVYRTTAAGTIDSITLRTPARDFIKPVTVEASDDRSRWLPLAIRYPVFRQSDGSERLAIRVAPGRYPYLRITVGDARERPIPLTSVTTCQTPPEPAEAEVVTVALDVVGTGAAALRSRRSSGARRAPGGGEGDRRATRAESRLSRRGGGQWSSGGGRGHRPRALAPEPGGDLPGGRGPGPRGTARGARSLAGTRRPASGRGRAADPLHPRAREPGAAARRYARVAFARARRQAQPMAGAAAPRRPAA